MAATVSAVQGYSSRGENAMRTTLAIDDDLLAAAKAMAQARSVSVGEVVSELMRKGLQVRSGSDTKSGSRLLAG